MDKVLALYEKTKNAKQLIDDAIFYALTRTDVLKYIDDLQRQRLEQKGEYFTGEKIVTFKAISGVYAPLTKKIRGSLNLPINRVTLKVTGEFHNSIKSEIGDKEITPSADFEKEDGNIGDNVDADKVLGWTDDDIKKIAKKILPIARKYINDKLLK